MKLAKFLFAFILTLSGCCKDDYKPISLYYSIINDKSNPVTNNQIELQYPGENIQLIVLGGDGNFVINNSDETKLKISINDKLINLSPLSIGIVTITISDKTNNSYILKVNIQQSENQ